MCVCVCVCVCIHVCVFMCVCVYVHVPMMPMHRINTKCTWGMACTDDHCPSRMVFLSIHTNASPFDHSEPSGHKLGHIVTEKEKHRQRMAGNARYGQACEKGEERHSDRCRCKI